MNIEGCLILVVEDEPIIAFGLEDMLLSRGVRPIVANSLESAENALAGSAVEAAILDVNVNGESSYALAEVLNARDIPFIFATGYGGSLHPEEFASTPTIGKPYALADIERAFAGF